MWTKEKGLFPSMPRRDRLVLAAAALLYMSGQLCEAVLGWWPRTVEWAVLLAAVAGLIYALALVLASHSS